MNRSPMPPRSAPLASTTPLQRGNGPARRAPLRSVSAARAREPRQPKLPPAPRKPPGEFTDAVKLLVRKRAGGGDEFQALAECCGRWLGRDAGEFQHRAARGSGGCRDAVVNGPSNCLLMCPEHHRQAEARDPQFGMGEAGFWLKHGTTPEFDPRNAGIRLHGRDGATTYLTEDGRYVTEAPEGAEAA